MQIVEFIVFQHGESWKVYRDGELVAVYPNWESATVDAESFSDQLMRRGKTAISRTLSPEEAAIFISNVVEI